MLRMANELPVSVWAKLIFEHKEKLNYVIILAEAVTGPDSIPLSCWEHVIPWLEVITEAAGTKSF